MKKRKFSEEEILNVHELLKLLAEAEEEQKNMTEEEKENNAIKMGDIYY